MMEKFLSVAIGVAVVGLILSFIPGSIALPNDIYLVLKNGFLKDVLQLSSYFFPISFGFKCLLIIYFARHINIIMTILNWILGILKG